MLVESATMIFIGAFFLMCFTVLVARGATLSSNQILFGVFGLFTRSSSLRVNTLPFGDRTPLTFSSTAPIQYTPREEPKKEPEKCKALTKSGSPCKSKPMPGTGGFCSVHRPKP